MLPAQAVAVHSVDGPADEQYLNSTVTSQIESQVKLRTCPLPRHTKAALSDNGIDVIDYLTLDLQRFNAAMSAINTPNKGKPSDKLRRDAQPDSAAAGASRRAGAPQRVRQKRRSTSYSSRVELDATFAIFDLDGSGSVGLREFVAGMALRSQGQLDHATKLRVAPLRPPPACHPPHRRRITCDMSLHRMITAMAGCPLPCADPLQPLRQRQ